MRKNCSSDQEKLLQFEAKGREFSKFLRSLEQFIQVVKGTIIIQIGKKYSRIQNSVTKHCSDLSLFE